MVMHLAIERRHLIFHDTWKRNEKEESHCFEELNGDKG